MLRHPKPPRREAKKPKPLKRTALKRRTKRIRGLSLRPAAVRRRAKDAKWAKDVKERDGGCVLAYRISYHNGPADAHHVFGKKAHPKLRHDVENGVQVCRAAHDWAHTYAGAFLDWFATEYPERWARLQEKAR